MNEDEGIKQVKIKSDQLQLCFKLFRLKPLPNDSRDIEDLKEVVMDQMNEYLTQHEG